MPLLSTKEARFIAALRRRDEAAFNALVLTFQDRVIGVCYRLIGSREDAEEVAQEVFVAVFEKIDRFRADSSLSTWIYRIATNRAKNRIRSLSRRQERAKISFDDMPVGVSDGRLSARVPRPDEVLEHQRLRAFLQYALGELDPEQRELVVLRDLEGLSYEAIGEITELAPGTIKSRLHRGRTRLKIALDRWRNADEGEAMDGAGHGASARAQKAGSR